MCFLQVCRRVKSWPFFCNSSVRLNTLPKKPIRRKAVWGPKRSLGLVALALALFGLSRPALADGRFPKLDSDLGARATAGSPLRTSRVIVTLAPGGVLPASLQMYDRSGRLSTINGHVLDVPDSVLSSLSNDANVQHVHGDRPVSSSNFRTAVTSGAFFARNDLGYT